MFAARYVAHFSWRESGAIGSLMSCKGYGNVLFFVVLHVNDLDRLVELIVLNVGLSAGILTQVRSCFCDLSLFYP